MHRQRRRMSRAKGCTLGCLAILLLMVIGVAGFFTLFVDPLFEGAASEIRELFAAAYEDAKAQGRVPEDHAPLFDELAGVAQGEETSAWSVSLIAAVAVAPLADGQVTDQEASDATAVRDLVKARPDLGISGFVQFLTENPDLMDRVRELDSAFENPAQVGGVSP